MGNFITFGLGGSDIDDFILFDLSSNDGSEEEEIIVAPLFLPVLVSFSGPADKYRSVQTATQESFRENLDKDWENQDWPDE